MLKYHTVSCFMWDFTGDQFFTNDLTSESAICWRVKGALSARDESVSHGMQVRSRFNELFLKHTETNKHPLERETELTWETAVMSAEELLLLMFNPKRSRPQRPNDARGRRARQTLLIRAFMTATLAPASGGASTHCTCSSHETQVKRAQEATPLFPPKREFTLTYPNVLHDIHNT